MQIKINHVVLVIITILILLLIMIIIYFFIFTIFLIFALFYDHIIIAISSLSYNNLNLNKQNDDIVFSVKIMKINLSAENNEKMKPWRQGLCNRCSNQHSVTGTVFITDNQSKLMRIFFILHILIFNIEQLKYF